MEHLTWTTKNKSKWGEGPWQNEPDKEQWVDEITGLPCLMIRNDHGALCGYVGVSEEHRWHGTDYNDVYKEAEADIYVHGGLTYSDFCMEGHDSETICHVPGPGEPEPLWWLGFHCNRFQDFAPASYARDMEYGGRIKELTLRISKGEVYRDREYVKAECAKLARQIAGVS